MVLLVETQWDDADIYTWKTKFPNVAIEASAAAAGPHGGRQGGVAAMLPYGPTVTRSIEVAPGCVGDSTLSFLPLCFPNWQAG